MDAISLLTDDHEKVRKLLKQLSKTDEADSAEREDTLRKIALELTVHTKIEQEIFYPAFKQAGEGPEDDKIYFEALEEHGAISDQLIPDAERADAASPEFAGRAKALREAVDHHADEEEKVMFHRAKKILSKDDLKRLGEQLDTRKQALMAEHGGVA
jgi:hemerythrin-like domain-containing protein